VPAPDQTVTLCWKDLISYSSTLILYLALVLKIRVKAQLHRHRKEITCRWRTQLSRTAAVSSTSIRSALLAFWSLPY